MIFSIFFIWVLDILNLKGTHVWNKVLESARTGFLPSTWYPGAPGEGVANPWQDKSAHTYRYLPTDPTTVPILWYIP